MNPQELKDAKKLISTMPLNQVMELKDIYGASWSFTLGGRMVAGRRVERHLWCKLEQYFLPYYFWQEI